MFPKWSIDNTRIGKLMRSVEVDKIYSKNEFKILAKSCGKCISNLMQYKIPGRDYGQIFQKTRNGYRIYPELTKHFLNTFEYRN